MIEVTNVSMEFPVQRKLFDYLTHPFENRKKTHCALRDINLTINSGDKVAFLGLNGAGKTTLLKLFGGLLYPTTGNLKVNGFDTTTANLKARSAVGFVLNEERSFYWRLSGRQNMEFFGALDNIFNKDLKSRIDELLGLVGLLKAQNKPVATYSSGMKQRLAIARGLLCDPQILILDEPTRTLDPGTVKDVKELIMKKIHEKQSRTLLIATHRFDEAEELCNKVCIMRNGEILSFDSLEYIQMNFNNVADYYHAIMGEDLHVA